MRKKPSERGSALFIILIAVVLFAALAFAVGQMMRGGNPDIISDEKAKLAANEILNYAHSLRQAAQNMKISNGCADSGISFENGNVAGYGHTPAASDPCKLFNSSGGGMVYQIPPAEWLAVISPAPALQGQWYFPADVCAPGTGSALAGCSSDGTDNEALIAVLPYIKKRICLELNELIGVANPGGNPPAETSNAWALAGTKYTGNNSDGQSLDQGGRVAGCFEGAAASTPAAGTYHFYQVLVPR